MGLNKFEYFLILGNIVVIGYFSWASGPGMAITVGVMSVFFSLSIHAVMLGLFTMTKEKVILMGQGKGTEQISSWVKLTLTLAGGLATLAIVAILWLQGWELALMMVDVVLVLAVLVMGPLLILDVSANKDRHEDGKFEDWMEKTFN